MIGRPVFPCFHMFYFCDLGSIRITVSLTCLGDPEAGYQVRDTAGDDRGRGAESSPAIKHCRR